MSFVTGRKIYFYNLLSSYLPYFAQIIITIIITPMLIKTFGQEKYGIFVLLNTLIGYFTLSNIGLPQTLIREIIHKREENNFEKINQMISTTFFYYLFAVVIVVLLNFLLFYLNSFNINSKILNTSNLEYIKIFSIGMLLVSFLFGVRLFIEIFESIIKSTNKIYITQNLKFINIIFYGLGTYIALKFFGTIESVIISNILVNIFILLFLYFQSKKIINFEISYEKSSFKVFKEMLPSSFWYMMSGITVIMIFQTDVIMISSLLGLASVSLYSLYFQFNNFLINIFQQIYTVRFSEISRLYSLKKINEIKIIYKKQLVIIIVFIFLYNLIMLNLGLKIFNLWINNIEQDKILFELITLTLSISLIGAPAGIICGSMGKHKNIVLVNLLNGFLNILLSYFLIMRIGIYGVIIGTFVSTLLTGAWFNNYYLKIILKEKG